MIIIDNWQHGELHGMQYSLATYEFHSLLQSSQLHMSNVLVKCSDPHSDIHLDESRWL